MFTQVLNHMSEEAPKAAKGFFFGKISKALASQSTKSLNKALYAKQNSDTSPRSSGILKSQSRALGSIENIGSGRRVSKEKALASNESLNTSISFKTSIKKVTDDDTKSKSITLEARSPSESPDGASTASLNKGNAAYEAIRQFNEQKALKRSQTILVSPAKGERANISIAKSNTNFAPHETVQGKETWPSSISTLKSAADAAKSRDRLDTIASDLDDPQKQKSQATAASIRPPPSSKTPAELSRNEAIMAQLRSTAALKPNSSSQQTMIDSRSMSGIAVGTGDATTRGRKESISQSASITSTQLRENMSNSNLRKNSFASTYKFTGAGAIPMEEFTRDSIASDHPRGTGGSSTRAPAVLTTPLTNTVKSPFGGSQVAAQQQQIAANVPFGAGTPVSPFQSATGAPIGRNRKVTLGSAHLNSVQRIEEGFSEDVNEEQANYKPIALKTIYSSNSGGDKTGDVVDFGFDQDSIFAVKGNIHLVQCFPNSGSPFTLNPGWETEAWPDSRYNIWRRVVFETIPAQRDLPLLLPEDLTEFLELRLGS